MADTFIQRLGRWLVIVALLGAGLAFGQAEPTVKQIYETAQSGKLDQAQVMVQQVLIAHPESARAHFVQAELFARQGLAGRGRESLARAEQLAPGLPFVRPEAVQALRTQLAAGSGGASSAPSSRPGTALPPASLPTSAATGLSSLPLGLLLALGGAVVALVVYLASRRSRASSSVATAAAPFGYGPGDVRSPAGSPTFGAAVSGQTAPFNGQATGPNYGPPPQGYNGYQAPAAQGSGMGGRVMGGLATGAAIGAGMMAAQALGRTFTNPDGTSADGATATGGASQAAGDAHAALPGNESMGGQDFGFNDAGSWDDAGGGLGGMGDIGGGGDWDT